MAATIVLLQETHSVVINYISFITLPTMSVIRGMTINPTRLDVLINNSLLNYDCQKHKMKAFSEVRCS